MLPDVTGATVIDLGCGAGALARALAEAGAAHVLAVDSSRRMLARAAPHPRVRYLRADLERLTLRPRTADRVVSSLALHYVAAPAPRPGSSQAYGDTTAAHPSSS